MNLVEINLSGTNEENVKRLCESLSRRFSGCTLYRTLGYWSEEGYLFKKSYEGITEEEGYGIKGGMGGGVGGGGGGDLKVKT